MDGMVIVAASEEVMIMKYDSTDSKYFYYRVDQIPYCMFYPPGEYSIFATLHTTPIFKCSSVTEYQTEQQRKSRSHASLTNKRKRKNRTKC